MRSGHTAYGLIVVPKQDPSRQSSLKRDQFPVISTIAKSHLTLFLDRTLPSLPPDTPFVMATEPRAYRARSGFGDNAPSKALPFPERANLTAAELLAFFPNSIARADVIYRMISNGGTRKSIHAIINTHRNLEVEWSANCCGAAMYKTMQKAGYSMWTIKKHDLWHASRKASWDSNALDVGGLRIVPDVPAQSVSFRSLAADVRTMPEGDDALDLTRMVQYCVQNSEDGWVYPKNYEELLDLLGGPAEVREENTDGAVFRRWENVKPPPPLPMPTQPVRGIDLLDGWEKSGRRSTVRRETTSSGTRSRTASPVPISLGEGGARRSSARTVLKDAANEEASDALDEADEEQSTPYIREPVSRALENYEVPHCLTV